MSAGSFFIDCPLSAYTGEARTCEWCAGPLRSSRQQRWCSIACSDTAWSNHGWTSARVAAKRRDGQACVRCGSDRALEVNHKIPVLGRHSHNGCHHHQENLETLCHDCHLVETARQRAAGELGRLPAVVRRRAPMPSLFDEVAL